MYNVVSEFDPEQEKKFGGLNDLPPNYQPVSRVEFEQKCLCHTYFPVRFIYKQVLFRDSKGAVVKMVPQMLYVFHGDYGYGYGKEYLGGGKHRLSYFKFAVCEHEMEYVPEESRMCYHVSKCKKCGYKRAVDSSD